MIERAEKQDDVELSARQEVQIKRVALPSFDGGVFGAENVEIALDEFDGGYVVAFR